MASAYSKFMKPPLSLPLTVSVIIPLSYLGLSLPLSLIIPHAPISRSLFNAYQGFISVQVLLQTRGFRWVSQCLALCPRDDSNNLASYEECLTNQPLLLASLLELLHQYSLITSNLQLGGNPVFLPSPFHPSPSPVASQNSNSLLLCMWDYDKTALYYQFPL